MFRKKTIFDLPAKESRIKFQLISKEIYEIIESDEFIEISSKIPVPAGATQRDIEKMLKDYAPKKIRSVLDFILNKNFYNIINILAIIFNEDAEKYAKKSINQISKDISKLTKSEVRQLLNLFTRAGQ